MDIKSPSPNEWLKIINAIGTEYTNGIPTIYNINNQYICIYPLNGLLTKSSPFDSEVAATEFLTKQTKSHTHVEQEKVEKFARDNFIGLKYFQ